MNEKCAILEGTKVEKLRFTAMEHEMNTIVNVLSYSCHSLFSQIVSTRRTYGCIKFLVEYISGSLKIDDARCIKSSNLKAKTDPHRDGGKLCKIGSNCLYIKCISQYLCCF